MPDRVEQLHRAAQARHDTTTARATKTLQALARHGEPITYARLARAANVSRSWLYRQPQLRDEIDRLRQTRPAKPTPQFAHKANATTDSLRQQLHIHRDEIARLQAENRNLKDQLARHLGASRAASITNRT